jgi:hypothetical protein
MRHSFQRVDEAGAHLRERRVPIQTRQLARKRLSLTLQFIRSRFHGGSLAENPPQWLQLEGLVARGFAKGQVHDLDLHIAGEQRRSEESLEFRKRSYKSSSEDAKDV